MYVASKTQFPDLFGNCYWGSFEEYLNPGITDEIVANRNKLAADFALIRSLQALAGIIGSELPDNKLFDHIESYQGESPIDFVVVTSPYGQSSECFESDARTFGFGLYDPLYNTGAHTFIKTFSGHEEIVQFLTEHGKCEYSIRERLLETM